MQPLLESADFHPQTLAPLSPACAALCQWVHTVMNYYFLGTAAGLDLQHWQRLRALKPRLLWQITQYKALCARISPPR